MRGMILLLSRFLPALLLLLPCLARADWITDVRVSDRAGVDSLERFLVIQDIVDSTFLGYSLAPMGDVTGDGIDDFIGGRVVLGHPPLDNTGFVFHGGNPPDGVFDKELPNLAFELVVIGDINGDGYEDFGATRLWDELGSEFYVGGPDMDDVPDFFLSDWSVIPRAADLDADGHLDMVLAESRNGGLISIYQIDELRDTFPEYVINDTTAFLGKNLCTGEFNGDGYPDLAVVANSGRDTALVKFWWGGPDFDTIPDFIMWDTTRFFGKVLIPVGDWNGDGYGDIFIGHTGEDPCGIHFGGPGLDNEIDVLINSPLAGYHPVYSAAVGDFNHDGWPDLVWGYNNAVAHYHFIVINLGGPEGYEEMGDVFFEETSMPLPQVDMGLTIANVGDFNGDGVDDIAFRSRTSNVGHWYAQIHLIAGWDSQSTDVPYEYRPTLPEGYELLQNYPNPFNPSTTIEFALPEQGSVRLAVYNVVGQKVRTLIDRTLPAGSYQVVWEGKDGHGRKVGSGVYFYRLEANNLLTSRKMILLK